MLAIRMQRTGRKGHAMFRVIVQDSRLTPTSGKVVARLGSYDPHAKTVTIDKEKASFYLEHGAQPSPRVVRLLQSESVKLPSWVIVPTNKEGKVRNADKRRSTRPAEPEALAEEAPAAEAEVAAEPATEEVSIANEASTEAPEATTEPAETDEPESEQAPEEETPAAEPEATSEATEAPAEPTKAEAETEAAEEPKA